MKFLLVIAIAVVVSVAVTSDEAPPCGNEQEILEECLNKRNMTHQEFTHQRGEHPSNYTAETFKKECESRHKNTNVSLCVAREKNRCGYGGGSIKEEAINEPMDIICNDPKIRFDCLAQFVRDTFHKNICDLEATPTPNQDLCEVTKDRARCSAEYVKKCDEYTGSVIEYHMFVSIARVCK